MPELPEVQTVVNHLKPLLVNKKIIQVIIFWKPVLRNISQKQLNKSIINNLIVDVYRKAKFITIQFNKKYV